MKSYENQHVLIVDTEEDFGVRFYVFSKKTNAVYRYYIEDVLHSLVYDCDAFDMYVATLLKEHGFLDYLDYLIKKNL